VARALLQEQAEEASRLAASAEAKRRAEIAEKDRRDRTESRVQEAGMVRAARGNLLGVYAMTAPISQKMARLGQNVAATLETLTGLDGATGKPRQLTFPEMAMVMRMMSTYTTCLRQLNEAGSKSMEMERLLLGEPQRIVGVQVEALSMDEAERRARMAVDALSRLRSRGLVIDARAEPAPLAQLPARSPAGDDPATAGQPEPIRRTGTGG
jgi:hypothetical protein